MFQSRSVIALLSLVIGYFWGQANTYSHFKQPSLSTMECTSYFSLYTKDLANKKLNFSILREYMIARGCSEDLFI